MYMYVQFFSHRCDGGDARVFARAQKIILQIPFHNYTKVARFLPAYLGKHVMFMQRLLASSISLSSFRLKKKMHNTGANKQQHEDDNSFLER